MYQQRNCVREKKNGKRDLKSRNFVAVRQINLASRSVHHNSRHFVSVHQTKFGDFQTSKNQIHQQMKKIMTIDGWLW